MDKTLNDAVKGLRQEFHRTRTTRDVMVSADDLGIVLDYLSAARAPSDAALVEALEEIESLLPTLEPIANQICPPGCLPTIGQQSKIDALVKPCAVAARALAAAKGQQP